MPSSATPQCSPRPLPQVTTRQTGARRITVRAHTPIIGAACGTGLPLLPISTQGTHALNAEDQKISSALLVPPPAVGESIEPRVAAGPAPRPKPQQKGRPRHAHRKTSAHDRSLPHSAEVRLSWRTKIAGPRAP